MRLNELFNTSMLSEKKRKKKSKKKSTTGAGMVGYSAGYSGNGGVAGGGSGGAVGEAVLTDAHLPVPHFKNSEEAEEFVRNLEADDTVDDYVVDPETGEVLWFSPDSDWNTDDIVKFTKREQAEEMNRDFDDYKSERIHGDIERILDIDDDLNSDESFYKKYPELLPDMFKKPGGGLFDSEEIDEEDVEEGVLNKINGGKRRIRRKVNITQRDI